MRMPSLSPASPRHDKLVLIVDDEPRNLDLIEVLLEPSGYRIRRAPGGAEAIELYGAERPDLVILDLMMPGTNGFEVLKSLRAERTVRQVPVIVVTAAGDRDARLRAFDLGADEFLDKPIDRSLLMKRAQALIELAAMRDALAERNQELESLQQKQRELTEFLVHDFKNPLSVIRYNAEWLARELDDVDADVLSSIADVATSARRLAAMIGDLLAISRLDANEAPPIARALCSFSQLAAELAHENSQEAAARGVSLVTLETSESESFADPGLVRRALANLLENALRHTPRGGRIEISVASERVSVSNSGPPIPEAEREGIFEKFRRAESASGHTSIGLGLYFCRRVAESHGGSIDVTSTSQWPVCFTLRIPGDVTRRKAC